METNSRWTRQGSVLNRPAAQAHAAETVRAEGTALFAAAPKAVELVGLNGRRRKLSTTIRLDSDVLAWLREPGPGYQSRINAILRREMLRARKG